MRVRSLLLAVCSAAPVTARAAPLPLALALALAGAPGAHAEVRSGDAVVVGAGEVVDGNLYVTGGNVAVHGRVRGDLVAVGGTVLVDGPVEGDVLVAAGQATLHGDIDGDLRAAVGSLALDGPVAGDAVGVGGLVALTSAVGGDALLGAGTAKVAGEIDGALSVDAAETTLDGRVAGDVVAVGERLALGARADVGGDLDWTGRTAVARAAGSTVDGTVQVHPVVGPPRWAGRAFGALQLFVGLYALGLIWLALFQGFARRATAALQAHPGACLGTGLAVVLGGPVVLLVVAVVGLLVGGAWLAPLGFAGLAFAGALAFPLVAATLAQRLGEGEGPVGRWLPLALLLAGLVLATQLPVVGGALAILVVTAGVGAIARALPPTLRFTRAPTRENAPLPSVGPPGGTPAAQPAQ